MTLWDFIYLIGYSIAFLMSGVGLTMINKEKIDDNFLLIILGAFMGGFFSWGLPIWWIGYKVYTRRTNQ